MDPLNQCRCGHFGDPATLTVRCRLSATRQIDGAGAATTRWLYADTANPGLPTRIVAPRGNTTATPDTRVLNAPGLQRRGEPHQR